MRKKSAPWLLPRGMGFFALTLVMIGCSSDKVSPLVNVTLLQTTDMHNAASGVGSFTAYTPMDTADNDTVTGGWARLATKIDEIRTAKETNGGTVLLVDSGDYTMGTVYDLLWNVDPAPFRFLNTMQYDLITLGNHEFDYGPKKLATMINQARAAPGGFNIPIIATNMVFDFVNKTADDDLETLAGSGVIVTDYYVKSYENGLKIGVIGIMGKSSDTDSPNAPPVTFKSDYAYEPVKSFIQGKVDALHNTEGVDLVIALSHSGITDPNGTPKGDDMTLAENITGIDIIASGHDHEMTDTVIPVVNGTHISYIICAGANGTNLAQLDLVVDTETKKLTAAPVLTNHPITDAILGDSTINDLVEAMNTSIDTILTPFNNIKLSDIVATSSLDLGFPSSAQEFGLGNLLADAVRYVGTDKDAQTPTIGLFANGVIRGGFKQGQEIAFADLFAVVPLGITTAEDQNPLLPGYPLLKVYANGNEVWDLCKFDATIMLYQVYLEYYSSLSGLQCTYTTGTTTITGVQAYTWDDYTCTGDPTTMTPIVNSTDILYDPNKLYPVIIDKYTMDMLLTQSVQDLLKSDLINVHLQPKLANGVPIDSTNLLSARLDRDAVTDGVQEYNAWSAALKFFNDSTASGGLDKTIPADPYSLSNLSTRRMIPE